MGDVFGRMVAFLFGAVMLFIVPTMIVAVKEDDSKQTQIDNAIVEFVDNARASGVITEDAYRTLLSKISQAHAQCDVQIEYRSTYSVPKYDQDTGSYVKDPVTDKYVTEQYLRAYNKEDIERQIYIEKADHTVDIASFPLREGGYLSVEVKNMEPTLGSRMLRLFLPTYPGRSLRSSYGGYVGNTRQ